jgi:hypothetical protein
MAPPEPTLGTSERRVSPDQGSTSANEIPTATVSLSGLQITPHYGFRQNITSTRGGGDVPSNVSSFGTADMTLIADLTAQARELSLMYTRIQEEMRTPITNRGPMRPTSGADANQDSPNSATIDLSSRFGPTPSSRPGSTNPFDLFSVFPEPPTTDSRYPMSPEEHNPFDLFPPSPDASNFSSAPRVASVTASGGYHSRPAYSQAYHQVYHPESRYNPIPPATR